MPTSMRLSAHMGGQVLMSEGKSCPLWGSVSLLVIKGMHSEGEIWMICGCCESSELTRMAFPFVIQSNRRSGVRRSPIARTPITEAIMERGSESREEIHNASLGMVSLLFLSPLQDKRPTRFVTMRLIVSRPEMGKRGKFLPHILALSHFRYCWRSQRSHLRLPA